MTKIFSKLALAAGALVALPGMAQAGTGTGTASASMNVVSQCSVAGAVVSFGTYKPTQTWYEVGTALGMNNAYGNPYTAGSQGQQSLNFGSVTCDAGMPYTLSIKGTGQSGTIKLSKSGWSAVFMQGIKKIGDTTVPDNHISFPGAGAIQYTGTAAGVGTGATQTILGNASLNFTQNWGTNIYENSTLGTAGTYTDNLTYTLTF